MATRKLVNGEYVDLTQEELNQINSERENVAQETFEVSLNFLRQKRNNLLAETDYLALSDQTMTAEMTTYRQALRDITNGLTTVEQVDAVVWPEKPEA
tara:strand:+ start:683 stop:976 length:294 start_codon:yes stop_codon:yes gene_type:complete